jgi:hypothetical protein
MPPIINMTAITRPVIVVGYKVADTDGGHGVDGPPHGLSERNDLGTWLVAFRLEDGQRCHTNQQDDTRDGEYENAASNGVANGFL